MIWVGILGPEGNFKETISKLIAGHPAAQISTMMDLQGLYGDGEYICRSHGSRSEYRKMVNAIKRSDIIFNGLPDNVSSDIYSEALSFGRKVIGISDEFIGTDQEEGACSVCPGSVYGLPELYRDKMKAAFIAANPSSYCTGILLGLAPIAACNLANTGTVLIESRSGAISLRKGDRLIETGMICSGGTKIYKVGNKDYAEEVNKQMHMLFGKEMPILHSAYIIPGASGIATTIKINSDTGLYRGNIADIYKDFYKNSPFIEFCDNGIINERVKGGGKCVCKIRAFVNEENREITINTFISDGARGAASQALQTMNLMCGIDGKIGL